MQRLLAGYGLWLGVGLMLGPLSGCGGGDREAKLDLIQGDVSPDDGTVADDVDEVDSDVRGCDSKCCDLKCGDVGSDVEEPLAWGPEFEWAELANPSSTYRPWVRWWWPGGDVEKAELEREIDQLVANGFGGAEIQAMEAALDPAASAEELAKRRSYDSEEFLGLVRGALEHAAKKGLAIDLTAGSGWPTGGTHIPVAESQKMLVHSLKLLEGPQEATIGFAEPDKAPFYEVSEMAAGFGEALARYLPEQAQLVEVVAAKVTGGKLDPNVLKVNDALTLDPESVQVLTAQVTANKKLSWSVPEGQWAVIGFWNMPDGEYVSLAAQAEKGFVVDHFDGQRVRDDLEHLLGERTGYGAFAGAPWRAFFNDSFEFKTERHFTADFLERFQQSRGYDLRPWLPVTQMPGADNHIFDGGGIAVRCPFEMGPDDERVRFDYQQTVSDLFIGRFIMGCANWAKGNGVKSRVQPYGLRVDVIRAAGETDIPEAEQLYAGGADFFVKMISSGAHLYNKTLVTAESLVWAGRDYMTTPAKLKAAADKLFVAGVNSLIYHGHPYRKIEGYGEQGWSAFSSPWSGMGTYSSNVSEGDSFWAFMPQVNRYVSRVQFLMQAGRAQSDVLVFYPFLGFPASLARMTDWEEPLFLGDFGGWEGEAGKNPLFAIVDTVFGKMDPGPAGTWLRDHKVVLDGLSDAGFAWDWVNAHSLAAAQVEEGGVSIRGSVYHAVVVMDAPFMGRAEAERLAELAEAGVVVVGMGQAPVRQPGFFEKEKNDAAVQAAWERIKGAQAFAEVGAGQAEDAAVAQALVSAGVKPVWAVQEGQGAVRLAHRYDEQGRQWTLVSNRTGETVVVKLAGPAATGQAMWVDCWAGGWANAESQEGVYEMELAPYGSVFLTVGLEPPDGVEWVQGRVGAGSDGCTQVQELNEWTLQVEGPDVAGGQFSEALTTLVDWREIPELTWSSSEGVYVAHLELSDADTGGYAMAFEWVHGAARVWVNGQEAGSLLAAPFVVGLDSYLKSGDNEIKVILTPPLRNRLLGYGDTLNPEYVQYKGKPATKVPVGLMGPAQLLKGCEVR